MLMTRLFCRSNDWRILWCCTRLWIAARHWTRSCCWLYLYRETRYKIAERNNFVHAIAFGTEFVWTTILVLVVLSTSIVRGHGYKSIYGLAIGGTVLSGVSLFGQITGSAFNPAVATGAHCSLLLRYLTDRPKSDVVDYHRSREKSL